MLRRALPALAVVAAVLAVTAAAFLRRDAGDGPGRGGGDPYEALDLAGTVLAEPWSRPSFTLTTTDGRPFDFAAETAGRLTLLFFGYTSCPDVCPIHLATLAGALDRPGVPRPVVVFVGIDPARDTPDAVRTFLDRFDPAFVGLVGTPDDLEAAQQATGVPVAFAEPADDDGGYLVGHASQVVAYTPDDLAHVVYPFGVRRQDWVRDLPRLSDLDWPDAEGG
ncbi:MAG: SCO family protein [Acidimicrobiia bacterium]